MGQVLWGEAINSLFVAVPSENYWDRLLYDIDHAAEDIVENPVYIILNLCRVLAYKWEQKILSKKGGGLWGLERLPERWHSLICAALKAYNGEVYLPNGKKILFAKFMLKEIMES